MQTHEITFLQICKYESGDKKLNMSEIRRNLLMVSVTHETTSNCIIISGISIEII